MLGIDAMTPADFRRPSRSRFLRGVKLTLVIAAAAWLVATTTARAQTDYVLSNVSAVLNGTPVSISGSFTFQPGFGATYLANIEVTAPRDSPYGGGYVWDTCRLGGVCDYVSSPNGVVAYRADGSSIQIGLAGGSITSIAITTDGNTVADSAPTGNAGVVGQAISYNFSSNASAVLNGKPESITGYFTFDPLTDIEYIAQLEFSGFIGTYGFDTERVGGGNVMLVGGPIDGLTDIIFANDLSFGTDPLAEVIWNNGAFIDSAPTGFVIGPTAPRRPLSPPVSPFWARRSGFS
jgi:hypothetical protein